MTGPQRFWAVYAAVGCVVEAYGLSRPERRPWTASPNIRAAGHTDHPLGRASVIAGAAWLAYHLIEIPTPKE